MIVRGCQPSAAYVDTNMVFFQNHILTSLRIITGSVLFLGSSPQVCSLYVSLSLSLWIFVSKCYAIVSQPSKLHQNAAQGFPQLDSKLCKQLPAFINFKPATCYLIRCLKILQWKRQGAFIPLLPLLDFVDFCHRLSQRSLSQAEKTKCTQPFLIQKLLTSFHNLSKKSFLKIFF